MFLCSYLEFDGSNLIPVFIFDKRIIKYLLSENNSKYFEADYPLIYKKKFKINNEWVYQNSIDRAIAMD